VDAVQAGKEFSQLSTRNSVNAHLLPEKTEQRRMQIQVVRVDIKAVLRNADAEVRQNFVRCELHHLQ